MPVGETSGIRGLFVNSKRKWIWAVFIIDMCGVGTASALCGFLINVMLTIINSHKHEWNLAIAWGCAAVWNLRVLLYELDDRAIVIRQRYRELLHASALKDAWKR